MDSAKVRALLLPAGVLSGVWLCLIALIHPVGEFPLNDDWVYAATARSLLEHGRLTVIPYTEAASVTHVLWGTLFCLPGGWSYAALRLSTALLGLVGVLTTSSLLRQTGASRPVAVLGGVTLALNPLYLSLSLTFMTDVPFTVLIVLALLSLGRSLRRDSSTDLTIGTLLSAAALLTRQAGLLVALAFVPLAFLRHGRTWKGLAWATLPSATCGAVLAVWHVWAERAGIDWLRNDRVRRTLESWSTDPQRAAADAAWQAVVGIVYVGLFCLPVLLPLASLWGSDLTPRARLAAGLGVFGLGAVAAFLALGTGSLMPLSSNVLFDVGLGPATLRDVFIKGLPNWPRAPGGFWLAVTALGAAGASLLVAFSAIAALRAASSVARRSGAGWLAALAGTFGLLYLTLNAVAGYFDRYLLPLVPIALVVAASTLNGRRGMERPAVPAAFWTGLALAAGFGLFSVAGTRDYFAWNRARWLALDDLMQVDGILPEAIDGGYEFNGLYRYDPTIAWWWAGDEEYVVSFGPMPGYCRVASYPFRRWLPPGDASVSVLRQCSAADTASSP